MHRLAWSLLILFQLLLTSIALAQRGSEIKDSPLRVEIPAGSDNETYRIIPCDSTGLVLFYKSLEVTEDGKVKWYFSFYDKDFQLIWTKGVPLAKENEFRKIFLSHDTLALFFQPGPKSRENSTNFQLLRILLPRGSFILNNGEIPSSLDLLDFSILKETFIGGFNPSSGLAQLVTMDLKTGLVSNYPVGSAGHTTFISMQVKPTDEVLAVMKKQVTKKTWDQFFITIGTDGKVRSESLISTINNDRVLTDSWFLQDNGNETLIAGTYLLFSSVPEQQSQPGMNKATGFFSTKFVQDQQKTLFFYNFLDLASSKSLMSERDMMNLKKKAMKKSRYAQEASSDMDIVLQSFIRHKDQSLLVSETYYPEYHTETFTDFDFYGRPFTNTYTVFEGYRFTNILVTAFDRQGNLLWDNSMEVRNLVAPTLEPRGCLFFSGDDIVLAYLSEGKVGSKIIHEGATTGKVEYSDIDLSSESEKLVTETKDYLYPWYDHYFIACGYQEIKSISGANTQKLVFYFNKLRFE